MSQENVDAVREAYEALSTKGIDAFSDFWAEQIEWQTMRDRWRGRQAGRAYLQDLADPFDDFTSEPVDIIDVDDEHVIVYLRYGGRSKRGNVAIPSEYFATVLRVRNGKITQALEFATREEALEAVGLSE